MKIFIPTYGRSSRQETWKNLPKKLHKNAVLVVQYRERHLYYNFPILVLPKSIQTVAPTRQWIVEHTTEKKIVMLDDDIKFCTRREDDRTKFTVSTEAEIIELFNEISSSLDSYHHVGVLSREGGNRVVEPYVTCTRMVRVLAYNAKILKSQDVRFDRLPLQEDFDVTLQLLRRGHPNKVLCQWVQDQGSSGAAGGCSHFRTMEMHAKNCHELARLHPGFVKVVKKTTKTAWGGGERTDVIIQWKRACHDR